MNGTTRTDDTTELLNGYVSGVNSLHGKLARIAGQHRDIIEAVLRMAAALRSIEQSSRR